MDGDRREGAGIDALVAEREDRSSRAPARDQPRSGAGRGDAGQETGQPRKRRLLPFLVFGAVLVAAAVGGTFYWLDARHYESTDDAFIDGYISQVAPQVSGRIIALKVQDNQLVQAGQELATIDPRDYQVRLDQARAKEGNAQAQLEQARAQVSLQQASIDQANANVRVAEADLFQAEKDFKRYSTINPQAIPKQQLDNANAALRSAQAKVDANNQAVAAAKAQLKAAQAQVVAAEASVRDAHVAVEQAELQLSYTHITAPQTGWVTKRSIAIGDYVSPGEAMLAIVPRSVWVTANFKETQLAAMKVGQAVKIAVDSYPSVTFDGRVQSFQAGTGSAFSSLPAENATGNYVKVVQRVPVKIVFDDDRVKDYRLSPGMSVVPTVKVR
jgi:membrane fusion protein (multidrug efflux system)